MENLLEYIKTDNFLLVSFILNILLTVFVLVNIFLMVHLHKKYIAFMKKLGNGNNLDEMLKKYLKLI